jgi:putative ABC transport system permease protein
VPDSSRNPAAPRWLRWIIRALVPPEDRVSLIDDLDRLFADRVRTRGRLSAHAWYARQTLGFIVHLGPARLADAVGDRRALRSDLRVALRSLRRQPAFTAAFVLTLAIGTGVLATVYSAANWVLLRPVPAVGDPGRLMYLRLGSAIAPPHVSFQISQPDFITLRERLPLAGALAASTPVDVDLHPSDGEPQRVAGEIVTANYFDVLRARLFAGRGFLASDDASSAPVPTVVMSYSMAARLDRDPAALVGRDVRINGALVRVAGVTARDFHGADLPGRAELWFPISALTIIDPSAKPDAVTSRGYPVWRKMVGRLPSDLKPSEGIDVVASAANAVMESVRQEYRSHSYLALHFRFQAFPGIGLDPSVRGTVRRTLALLAGAAALLFALAVANLANLAVIRSASRGMATAIRRALGASSARIARHVMVEMILLGVAGGVVAILLAAVWSAWFQGTQLAEHGGGLTGMHVSVRVLLLTMAIALVGSFGAYFKPTFSAAPRSLEQLLRRGAGGGPSSPRARMMLVSFQVALSLMLLVAAGLLGRTVANLRDIDLGFQPGRLLTFSLDPQLHGYEAARLDALGRDLERRLTSEPGIDGAGFIAPSPLRSSYVTGALYRSRDPDVRALVGAGFYVTPGFLKAIGVRVIAGDRDWRADSGTVVITRATLTQLLPGTTPQDAVGRFVLTQPNPPRYVRIAAVIENVSLSDITNAPPPVIFRPLSEGFPGLSLSGFVTTARSPMSVAPVVRRVIQAGAPELPLFDIRSARAAVDLQFAERNAMARVALSLSLLGVLLAATGLYGVLANAVAMRQREIGIRTALGAAPRVILSNVLVGGLVPVFGGVVAGLLGAALVSKLLSTQLYGLARFDLLTYAGGIAVLLAAATTASSLPAYRAMRLSPAEVLRDE